MRLSDECPRHKEIVLDYLLIRDQGNSCVQYKIDTESAGLFFRNQLTAFDTEGGNRNKMVLIGTKSVEW